MDLRALASKSGTVILDTQRPPREGRPSWLLSAPERVLEAWSVGEVEGVLREAERLAAEGRVVAGFLAYEAARAFDLTTHEPRGDLPLAWFGVYAKPVRLAPGDWPDPAEDVRAPDFLDLESFNVTPREYAEALERAREWIAAGDTYQVNLTCKCRMRLAPEADPFALYCLLRRAHPVPHGVYLNLGGIRILSLSPELFLRRRGRTLLTRPMKGTMRRALTSEEDERLRRRLRASPKERAENVMIVDLMRNDLGRVSEIGSVRVPSLFQTERYETVHQMTSTVLGRARADCGFLQAMQAAFPCGSVTGAPKRRTMEIIRELEEEPRGVYCGAIGRVGPGDDMDFNVAIRTIVHRDGGACEMGVGSGVTWSSDAEAEWAETCLKSRFIHARPRRFRLIETMLLSPAPRPGAPGRIAMEREHLARLARSARYWGFPFPRACLRAALETEAARAVPPEGVILRLALGRSGELTIEPRALGETPRSARLILHPEPVRSADPLLYHKTDARALYDRATLCAREAGCLDALLVNELGHLTEGGFTNFFAEIGGRWTTPPIADGLLPGLWRAAEIRRLGALERSLTPDDLSQATRLVVGNSVRGAIEVEALLGASGRSLWTRPGALKSLSALLSKGC